MLEITHPEQGGGGKLPIDDRSGDGIDSNPADADGVQHHPARVNHGTRGLHPGGRSRLGVDTDPGRLTAVEHHDISPCIDNDGKPDAVDLGAGEILQLPVALNAHAALLRLREPSADALRNLQALRLAPYGDERRCGGGLDQRYRSMRLPRAQPNPPAIDLHHRQSGQQGLDKHLAGQ